MKKQSITRKELIEKYLKFFESKKHKVIPSSSLVPANDPTVLFTTAGMHPLVPYLLGQKHPLGRRLVNVQRCIRTTDIDEVGDDVHLTFFEMLGNWSLGDYFKEDSIKWSYEFLTIILKIKPEELTITCFAGDKDAPKDEESSKVWLSLGIKKDKIKFLEKKDNWWGPAGVVGPCGPDTEIFFNGIEIWNNVFMEYNKTVEGKFIPLAQKNVDTGMGVERTLAILNSLEDVYMTDCLHPLIEKIESLSGKKYKSNKRAMRIIADHVRASVFLIGDGVSPGNTGRDYVLRRLIRRAVINMKKIGLAGNLINSIADKVFEIYSGNAELQESRKRICDLIDIEEKKFGRTLDNGLEVFNKISPKNKTISGEDAFLLYQSYGFPVELTGELAKERGFSVDVKTFEQELKKHQELSRTTSSGSFKSGLADSSEKTTRLHTATHLLNEALRKVLGPEIKQRGSNITPERLRFDFNFDRKLTEQEIKEIEALVNKKIKEALLVVREEMPLQKALKSGAQSEFGAKYPSIVSVYSVGDFSKEICTGPHVKNTKEIGKFKIIKEESSAAGIRRIKAVVE